MSREDKLLQSIAEQLADQGYAIINHAPGELTRQLYQRVTTLVPEAFKPAGIGCYQAHILPGGFGLRRWARLTHPADPGHTLRSAQA